MENKKKYMSIGNIFNETFNLYFNNFIKLCIPYIIVVFPSTLIIQMVQKNTIDSLSSVDTFGIFVVTIGFTILTSLISSIAVLFIIIISSRAYNNEKESLANSLMKMLRKFFPYLLFIFIMYAAITLGTFLLVVPGVILTLGWYVATVVFVEEDLGIFKSLSRCWNLTKGYKGTLFGISILIGIIVMTILTLISVIVSKSVSGSVAFTNTISLIPDSTENIIFTFLSQIIAPITTCMVVVIYFNLKKDKESFDTEQLADSFLEEHKDNSID